MAEGTRLKSLAEAVAARAEVERCPCTGCLLASRCAAQEVACRHFFLYVGYKGRRSRSTKNLRSPTRGLYERIFSGVEEESA